MVNFSPRHWREIDADDVAPLFSQAHISYFSALSSQSQAAIHDPIQTAESDQNGRAFHRLISFADIDWHLGVIDLLNVAHELPPIPRLFQSDAYE